MYAATSPDAEIVSSASGTVAALDTARGESYVVTGIPVCVRHGDSLTIRRVTSVLDETDPLIKGFAVSGSSSADRAPRISKGTLQASGLGSQHEVHARCDQGQGQTLSLEVARGTDDMALLAMTRVQYGPKAERDSMMLDLEVLLCNPQPLSINCRDAASTTPSR
ncbi:hypothetical protein VV02_18180 [Luteipulveratus mongoliensis]|uniref:Uncharacterized protein n=1 Tax=Luteipulveratus mongoliensis TaxID=571913 RepID=A0A0K1JKS9_9MICO|nr:hypothetical protein VV02_18180 [Luteipulveratus mongoliensis]